VTWNVTAAGIAGALVPGALGRVLKKGADPADAGVRSHRRHPVVAADGRPARG